MSRDIDFSKQLSKDEAEYVIQRPWLITDAEISGHEIQWPKDAEPDGPESEEEEEEVDYNDLSISELKAEIKARNQDDGATEIIPVSNKKEDLVFALQQDDVRAANTFAAADDGEPVEEPEES